MKQQLWFTLILTLLLTGCGVAEAHPQTLQPLDDTAWPTPQPAAALPTPTPFPKISLADLGTPTPTPAVSLAAAAAVVEITPTPLAGAETVPVAAAKTQVQNAVQSYQAVAVAAQNNEATATLLSPPLTARMVRPQADLRPGPETTYAPIDTLADDQAKIEVLAVDPSSQWALVKPEHSGAGWMTLADLTVTGELSTAPQVVTTWIASNGLILHTGPGIYTPEIGPVPTNSLMRVHGLNEGRSWALVSPVLGGGQGWLPLQFITPSLPAAELAIVKDREAGERLKDENENQPSNLPTFQPSNAQPHLVFQLSSGGDIMVINPDGTGLRRLTSGLDPALSPDGQQVAFTRWAGETGSLWTINLDGTNERQVSDFTRQAKSPSWSPDGSKIALNFQHGGRLDSKTECADVLRNPNPAIPWNANVPTDNVGDPKIKIHINEDYEVEALLCWKLPPDPHWGLQVVNLADGHTEDADGGTYAFHPTWDPAQPWRIISDGGMGLVEADITRKTARRLTDEITDSSPAFSPDGRYLAVTMDQGGGTDIFRLNRDGSGRVRLTKTPLWITATPDKAKPWHNVAPTWSPDASQIAFLTDRTGRWEIWVMAVDGSNPQPLFPAEVNAQLNFVYNFVDEQVLSWR